MSVAKKAVDSTIRRILNYTAEIILSIILLVIICLPLVFTIPMWLQYIVLGRPRTELALDPTRWFGADGAFWLTILLGLVSFALGYIFILRLKPGSTILDDSEEAESEESEEEEEFVENEATEEVEEVLEEEVEAILEEEEEEEEEEEFTSAESNDGLDDIEDED